MERFTWTPMPALFLPHWGEVCPFVIKTDEYIAVPLPLGPTEHNSVYYIRALELFTISAPLSLWKQVDFRILGDDVRGLTFTPAGRWISILDQFVQINSVPRETAIEAYFKSWNGLSDALVLPAGIPNMYNLEAPGLYKEEHPRRLAGISSFSKFSKLSSGHSAIGGVSATILENLFGNVIDFTDKSHIGRIEFWETQTL